MSTTEKLMKATTGLLVVTIVSGYVVARFAPRIGNTIAITSYALAGVTSWASVFCAIQDI